VSGLTSVSEGAALSHPRPEILALTGLRGLAGVAVVASTVGVWRTAPEVLHDLVAGVGALAVPFFLLLSGYVLAYNYPSLSYSSGRQLIGRYVMARVARLAPLFLIVGACVLLLGALNGGDWVRAVYTDQAWFVATVVLCYAAYPLLAGFVASRRVTVIVAALVATALPLVVELGTGVELYRIPIVWLPVFVLGMTLRVPSFPRWLANRVLVRLGVISYPLFLTHTLVIHGFGRVPAGSVSNALLALCWIGLAVLVAEGAQRYVGVPGRRWLMDLARRLDRRTASVDR
jgi:peptidoglycan/LPS O-acetylase OafA/YrhL